MHDGLQFVPLDVFLDEKFELIEAQYGLKGFALVVKLLQRVYSKGFYCEWTKDIGMLFARRNGADHTLVSDIVDACVRRGLFDKGMFERYGILTSHGIQKRYFDAVSRRKKLSVEKKFLLLTVEECPFLKNVCNFEENADNFPKNVCSDKEKGREGKGSRREVEGKGRKGKRRERAETDAVTPPVPPAIVETLNRCCIFLTPSGADKLMSWLPEMQEEVITYAIEQADAQGKRSIAYIEAILRRLHTDGLRTIEAVREREAKRRRGDKSTSVYQVGGIDYDEIEKRMDEKY